MKSAWLLLGLLSCGDSGDRTAAAVASDPSSALRIRLDRVASGLQSPLYLTAPAGDARLFVVEKGGRIRIIENGQLLERPFLDVKDRISEGSERGLLSVAFHPRYATNGFFYVNYTDRAGDTRIERYHVSSDRGVADPGSAKLILSIDQPYSNHNGGLNLFGPDGMLYIGMGDGGGGGDRSGNGQNKDVRLGKILRIDVDRGDPYAIPPNNPYANGGGAKEAWSTGMRNPWRFSFDAPAGLLIVADVGEWAWEEINAVPASAAGLNYGWSVMEGTHCFRALTCSHAGMTEPVHEYSHSDGCSIAGGYVYRGRRMPDLVGTYFYSDYCQGWLKSLKFGNGRATSHQTWPVAKIGSVLSFGLDAAGEMYILTGDGGVYRIAPDPS
ncbi:MAG: PQQ-dependent sugar dehydrogenase [Longimicrobiales bacterium]